MVSILSALLVLCLLINLLVLGTSRIGVVIRSVAIQGVLLGSMPVLVHVTIWSAVVSVATVLIKGILIPRTLDRAMREVRIKREVEPLIGLMPSMILGALVTGVALLYSERLPLAPSHSTPLLIPASLATVLVGFLLIVSRVKAISQVLGYLVLENGIFIFGVLLFEAMPFLVEMGVLLDLLVAIFVTTIIINRINREFASLDTRRFATLRE